MQRKTMGRSGLSVSRLCLGTMMFGVETEEADARRIVDAAFDAGVNFIDTADVYHRGVSEEVVGRLIADKRADWVLATKVGSPFDPAEPNRGGLSRRWIAQALDASLARLGTDCIDIYYWHREDPNTALEESVAAMGDAIRAGKIRYFALSNFKAWRHAEVVHLCRALGIDPPGREPALLQRDEPPARGRGAQGVRPLRPRRGAVQSRRARRAERQVHARPAAGGGHARRTQGPAHDADRVPPREPRDRREGRRPRAASAACPPVQFAVNWVLANPIVTAAIVGPRTPEQMTDYLGTFDHDWTDGDEALIDAHVGPGYPSTHGFQDPAYPIEGRPTPQNGA